MKLIFDVFNTLLYPPTIEEASLLIARMEDKYRITLNDECRKWMQRGWTLAPLSYLAGVSFPTLRDHCLVTDYLSIHSLAAKLCPRSPDLDRVCDLIIEFDKLFNSQIVFEHQKQIEQLLDGTNEIHLLSNANFLQRDVIRMFFDKYPFKNIWISCEIGQKKPSVDLLSRICGANKDFVCIGDSHISDIAPARSIGLQTKHATDRSVVKHILSSWLP